MKLKKVIKYLDQLSHCKIWVNEEEDPMYEGSVMDIPWYLLDFSLDNDGDGEAISAAYDKQAKNPNHYSYFAIYLKEED